MDLTTFAVLGGIIAMLGFGISDFFAKTTIDKVGNLKTLLYVQFLGIFFLIPYLLIEPQMPEFTPLNILKLTIFGVFSTIGYLALYKSFEIGKISIVSPISSSYSVLAAIISFLFFGEAFTQGKLIVLAAVIIGVILTAFDPKAFISGLHEKDLAKGVPEAILMFVIFGIYTPFWNRFISTPGWFVWVILIRLFFVFFLVSYSLFIKKESIKPNIKGIWMMFLLVSLFEAVGSFGSAWGLHNSVNNTSIATAITSTYPMVTILLAFTVLKERLKSTQYFGIALIMLGLFFTPFL